MLPNLPFWLLAHRKGIATPGWINLDGLVFGVAALYIRPSFLFPLFVADFLLDVADAICFTYGVGFVDVAHSAAYMTQVLAHAQLRSIAILIGVILAVVGAVWVWLRPRLAAPTRRSWAAGILAFSLLWFGAARLPAHSPLAHTLRSPAADFVHAWRRESMWNRLRGVGPDAMATAASAADQAKPYLQAPGPRPNFVLVLVESWGSSDSAALRGALLHPFTDPSLARRYRIQTGLVHFNGPTGNGIMRELCNLNRGVSEEGTLAPSAQLQGCLPFRLQHSGYQTTAIDSVVRFWPGGPVFFRQLGIQNVVDYHQLHAAGMTDFIAGPFRSIRDQDAAALLPKLLLASRAPPQFIFFLTVSAHLPVHLPLPSGYDGDCSIAPATRDSAQACGWYRIERQTLASLATAALAPGLPPTVFVIVGDHKPPFVDSARDDFSPDNVPYVVLAPHPSR